MTTGQTTHRLAVLGAGVMGRGITTTALGHGISVVLIDVDPDALAEARPAIAQQLRHAELMGVLPDGVAHGELTTSRTVADAADATAVVEAVTELAEVKAKALAEISAVIRRGTPVISNTSGIPIDEMADAMARPDELAGTHFMNPTYLIRMAEVVRGPRTSDATMAAVLELLTALGRETVTVRDTPGFVTSRLLHPMINDAARLVGEGVASAEAVDTLMRGCLGHPTGPLRTADLIGLDNLVDALAALHERTGEEAHRPCGVLVAKVREGALGRKSGRGFYDYGKVSP